MRGYKHKKNKNLDEFVCFSHFYSLIFEYKKYELSKNYFSMNLMFV
jgi:hypothetical protein